MPAIETTSLTKRFGEDVVAVDDLDLTVEEGEIFGFLGPNGAGKSTTINLLLDFVRPTAGSATVLGLDTRTRSAEIGARTGVLPEDASLYDRLTGREHLSWMARVHDVDADVDALLDRVGLSPADGDRPAGDYSTGMGQRLALAMALVDDPDLLILDEPSAGLDPTGMQEIRELIAAEADRGTTVFFSSHILGEVEAVCDRIAIMNEGRLVASGTLEALRDELDVGAAVSVTVDPVPADVDSELTAVEGVRAVDVDGSTVTATVDDATRKIGVIGWLDERSRVLDVVSEDTSLEQLFNTYTSDGRSMAPTGEPAASGASASEREVNATAGGREVVGASAAPENADAGSTTDGGSTTDETVADGTAPDDGTGQGVEP